MTRAQNPSSLPRWCRSPGDVGPKNLDPWGFEALAVARGRGTAPTSLLRFAHEVGRGTADWEAKHADFRSRYLVWVQEVMHPRAQCWGASFWENFENGVSRDWQQAVAYAYDRLCLIDEGILTQGHHVQAQWWAGFWGTEGYPLPSVPSTFLPYREKRLECFPHLQDGLTLDRQGSQRREDWVLRNRDGAVVVPGMLKPLPGWAKGPNPGTTDRWRKEVEQNFRSPRPGGRWRW